MKPFQLTGTTPDGKAAHVWACGVCRIAAHNEEAAERCCRCTYCGESVENDKYNNRKTSHEACRRAEWARCDQERIDKAEKLDVWDGGVLWNETYYNSVDDAVEAMDCAYMKADHWPEFIFVAKRCPPKQLDSGWILENYCDDMGEEFYDYLKGVKEFEAACEAFNAANREIAWYEEDYNRMVRVPPQTVESDDERTTR